MTIASTTKPIRSATAYLLGVLVFVAVVAAVTAWGTDLFRPVYVAAAGAEQRRFETLLTEFQTGLPSHGDTAKVTRVSLEFRSEVDLDPATGKYRYTYSLQSGKEGTAHVRVAWKSLEESEFGRTLLQKRALYAPMGTTGLAQPTLVLTDAREPRIQRYGADIYAFTAAGEPVVMSSPASAYVPVLVRAAAK